MNKLFHKFTIHRLFRLVILLALLLPVAPAIALDSTMVTAKMINAKLKEVEATASLGDDTRDSLLEMLNNALGNLENIDANKTRAAAYSQSIKTAPEETSKIEAQLEKNLKTASKVKVKATTNSPFNKMESELLPEKANLAAVKSKLDDLKTRIEFAVVRPAAIQKQLLAANQDKDDLESKLKLPVAEGELPLLTKARHWAQNTRIAALRSETSMLDQELLSMPMRIKLLKAQQDQTAYTVERVAARVAILSELVAQKGSAQAEEAKVSAEAAVSDAASKHPLIQDLAQQNAVLTRYTSDVAAEFSKSNAKGTATGRERKHIEDSFRSAREKLEVAGMSDVLGEVLRHKYQNLPDLLELNNRINQLEKTAAQSALRQILYTEEYKHLRHLDDYVNEKMAALETAEAARVRPDFTELASARLVLLENTIDLNRSYARSLADYAANSRHLRKVTAAYDKFLAENLLWLRSVPVLTMPIVLAIPEQIMILLSPERWGEVLHALMAQWQGAPWLVLVFALIGVLLWKARHLKVLLRRTAEWIGIPSRDKMSYTFSALGLTVLLAAPLPLLLAALGWQLGWETETTPLTSAISIAMLQVFPSFMSLQFFRVLCLQGGVAEKHFKWPQPIVKQLRRNFARLMMVFLPAVFILRLLVNDEQQVLLAGLERISLIVTLIALAVFFQRLTKLLIVHSIGSKLRLRFLWPTVTVLVPLILVVLAIIGYLYTASVLGGSLIQTLWFLFFLVVLQQLVVRWLLLVQRRLALQVARDRRAEQEAKAQADAEVEGFQDQIEDHEVDLVAMSEESHKLLDTLLAVIGIVGLWQIWSDVLPALNILNEVTLWHHEVMVAGEKTFEPVTLASIGIAVLIVVVTFVTMKRLPALLEIVLLQRANMTIGTRYTATTLTTYSIVAIGLTAFFNVIGADWSKLQWLFAALSVGIGFGLQEIVANFISGLIILFERPIRVGDVVTIGDTDGIVTRIQIRATTIRNWDNQELLVPNKEFITGRLLNWSLSDQIIRIKVPVGIAYGGDVQKAMMLMGEAAKECDNVLAEPVATIIFGEFGDNSLNLELRCFVASQMIRKLALSQLHEAINEKFNDAGIVIAFPQRDVHLDTSAPFEIRLTKDDKPKKGNSN
jgi:potassium efflux system protein